MTPFAWGVLGAAAIADGAMIPAIGLSTSGGRVLAIASRSHDRAASMAAAEGVSRIYGTYEELLADDQIDGVYIALPNAAHTEWTIKALDSGKHVLCEKPLATTASEGEQIAAAATRAGRLAMEAFMYRFNARTIAFCEAAPSPRYVHATFSYPQKDPANIRLSAPLAGGALMDLGCYTVNIVRWLLGEPDFVTAVANVDAVDRSVAATLHFQDGALATIWASFETPEAQEVTVLGSDSVARTVHRPFGAWFDHAEPDRLGSYRKMVDAFVAAAISDGPSPLPLSDSIANLRVLDRIRASAGMATPG